MPVPPALPHPPLQEGLPRTPLHRHHVTARKPWPSSQSTSPASGPGPPPPPRPLVTVSVSLLTVGQVGSPHPTPGFLSPATHELATGTCSPRECRNPGRSGSRCRGKGSGWVLPDPQPAHPEGSPQPSPLCSLPPPCLIPQRRPAGITWQVRMPPGDQRGSGGAQGQTALGQQPSSTGKPIRAHEETAPCVTAVPAPRSSLRLGVGRWGSQPGMPGTGWGFLLASAAVGVTGSRQGGSLLAVPRVGEPQGWRHGSVGLGKSRAEARRLSVAMWGGPGAPAPCPEMPKPPPEGPVPPCRPQAGGSASPTEQVSGLVKKQRPQRPGLRPYPDSVHAGRARAAGVQ